MAGRGEVIRIVFHAVDDGEAMRKTIAQTEPWHWAALSRIACRSVPPPSFSVDRT